MTLFRRPSPTTAGDPNDESSRSVTPTETPVAPDVPSPVLSSPPRPRPGANSALPERRPAPGGPPPRPPSAEDDGPEFPTERRPVAPSGTPERRPPPGPSPSVIVSSQEPPRRPAAPAAPPAAAGGPERRPPSAAPGAAFNGPERRTIPPPAYSGTERRGAVTGSRRALDPSMEQRFWPAQPRALEDTGLTATFVEELVLKALFFAGEMRGMDLASRLQLPTSVVDDIIEGLRRQKYVDIRGGGASGVGKSTMIYQLTPFVTDVLRQILDRNRYNGPAPIPFQEYVAAVKKQTVRGNRITRARMQDKFGDLIIRDYIYDGIGPAMNSGRAIFFYGPPGNGKTAICQGMVNCFEGDVFIPHAILIDDFVVRVFDSNLHKPVEDDNGPSYDRRWVRCRRPLVVVGGELTLEMLDLVYSPEVKYYEAPFQMKASNGMLLIDDFGRQKVSPRDLLNRWIVPLESDIDMLTLHTGKKLQVPFDVFAAFSTNLDPSALVDDAFLRRVRYKLEVRRPDEEQFHQIFEVMCRKRGVAYNANAVDYLIDAHYRPTNRPFAACQPRDLLDQVIDMSHYLGQEPRLDPALLDAAVRSYFVRFDKAVEATAASAS
ncbi:ATPase [Myxococcus stipitatus]|uniref:ATPase n=1 Tax=Myxococcus stipitatus TaxID=83455 RepID=UPI001F2B3BBB|nr:ATPase [Myxococcus stipitatus]MCE9670198.1 ATPase [Myxococcus stipitatus]